MNERIDGVSLSAVQEFRDARLQAKVEQIKAALSGKSADLLSYEEVREKIRAKETNRRQLKDIPLDAIVGSVGRYKDFTRKFFPLVEEDEERWARILKLTGSMEGLPPIEVFQIGEVYFVRDGNHRVSVARELQATHIEAYVTQVESAVPLEADMQPDDLIIKERYVHFLERTNLDQVIPDLDLSMSAAGNYRVLERQIALHQHWVQENKGKEISFPVAAKRWYKHIYFPVIRIIRERGMMRDFPNRTETDLYVWVDKHRHELADKLNWSIDAEQAIIDLSKKQSNDPKKAIKQLGKKVQSVIIPPTFLAGPQPGEWREQWLSTYNDDKLFTHILVAIDGQEAGWIALQQAIKVAQKENGKIYGLHVLKNIKKSENAYCQKLKDQFNKLCNDKGINGQLTFASGPPTDTIIYRAGWADLVVVSLSHPPGPKPVDRLNSKFAQLLRSCPCPLLAVPSKQVEANRLLLAYDGSPKANEALFIARYMLEKWQIALTILSVKDKKEGGKKSVARARRYLEGHNLNAQYISSEGKAAEVIVQMARDLSYDLILMGGYGGNPVAEIAVGSVVDEVLRSRNRPVLVCR